MIEVLDYSGAAGVFSFILWVWIIFSIFLIPIFTIKICSMLTHIERAIKEITIEIKTQKKELQTKERIKDRIENYELNLYQNEKNKRIKKNIHFIDRHCKQYIILDCRADWKLVKVAKVIDENEGVYRFATPELISRDYIVNSCVFI